MFGIFKAAKPHTLTIEGAGEVIAELIVEPKETILTAALRQGIRFPHSCKAGGCATCKCKLVDGKIKELTSSAFILSSEDLDNGMVLGCQTQLRSDATIRIDSLVAGFATPVLQKGIIIAKRMLTHDITQITVTLPEAIAYQAGQYAQVSVPSIAAGSRSYSFATPAQGNEVMFFIRQVPNGEVSGWMKEQAAAGDEIEIDGPYGDFYLRNGNGALLMVAGGSGLAPILAMLEEALNFKTERDLVFIFGARTQQDLYALNLIQRIAQNWAGTFQFIPVLSAEPEDSDWQGARGFVTDHIDSLGNHFTQTYMCGPPPMLDAVESYLKEHKLSPEGIYSDRFLDRSYTIQTTKNVASSQEVKA
ncbi:MAG: 2Fe-2S iron-sulfur cluster binding domain-containing protein [Oleibacter sp.]|nr:2Fe-2S iron-sulfur cluster binding domain-containing protein [Thalassolituus sp.]